MVDAILDRYPEARVVGLAFRGGNGAPPPPWIDRTRLVPVRGRRRHFFAPAYARLIAAQPLDDARLVVSLASTGWSRAAAIPGGVRHVCIATAAVRPFWSHTDAYLDGYPNVVRPLLRGALPLLRAHDRALMRRPDRLVTISRYSARLIESIHGRAADVVYPPVRTAFFTPGAGERRHVLAVARLVAHKRIDVVAEAFRDSDLQLVVAGGGPWLERLRALAPHARFTGYVSDAELRELYRASHAVVCPSVEEFGLVVAEAQACGVPVVSPRAGAAPEVVRDGETGILLDRVDAEATGRAVASLVRRPPAPDACRASALRFTEERFVGSIGEIIHAELALGRPRSADVRSSRADLSPAPRAPR